jgi:hypothetical protein
MNRRIFFLLSGATALISIALFLKQFLLPNNDIIKQVFPSYSDANLANAFSHGMIPDFLPKSSTQISSERNIDLDTLVVSFNFGNDFNDFLSKQKKQGNPPPQSIIEQTPFSDISADRLDYFFWGGINQMCAAHLIIDRANKRATYIYNLAPHSVGCMSP